jgi:hypothetical protein
MISKPTNIRLIKIGKFDFNLNNTKLNKIGSLIIPPNATNSEATTNAKIGGKTN